MEKAKENCRVLVLKEKRGKGDVILFGLRAPKGVSPPLPQSPISWLGFKAPMNMEDERGSPCFSMFSGSIPFLYFLFNIVDSFFNS